MARPEKVRDSDSICDSTLVHGRRKGWGQGGAKAPLENNPRSCFSTNFTQTVHVERFAVFQKLFQKFLLTSCKNNGIREAGYTKA